MTTPPSTTDSPSTAPDTPAVDSGLLRTIRASIEPRGGWWQFHLRPWHYWTAIASTAVVTTAFVYVVLTHGGIR